MTTERNVRVSARLDVPVHEVYLMVSSYERAPQVIEGLEQLTPAGGRTAGVGARFDAVMRIGPRRVRASIEIEELVEDRLVRWRSSGGDDRSITFEMRRLEEEELTAVRISVAYASPDGIAGALVAPLLEQAVREHARASLERLRELSERGAH